VAVFFTRKVDPTIAAEEKPAIVASGRPNRRPCQEQSQHQQHRRERWQDAPPENRLAPVDKTDR
jgi:hypothetical protein